MAGGRNLPNLSIRPCCYRMPHHFVIMASQKFPACSFRHAGRGCLAHMVARLALGPGPRYTFAFVVLVPECINKTADHKALFIRLFANRK